MKTLKLIAKSVGCILVIITGVWAFNQLSEITPDMTVGVVIIGAFMFGCFIELINCISEIFKSKTMS